MKKITILFAVLVSLTATAQITITQSNFPRPAAFEDTAMSSNQSGLALPSEGANQVWDYSNVSPTGMGTSSYTDATSSTDFPGALQSNNANLNFQGFIIEGDAYFAVDSLGWYGMGRTNEAVSYPLGAVGGGPNDSLKFLDEVVTFGGRLNLLQFPLTYQTTWTNAQTEVTSFELTVVAASLSNTPGNRTRLRTDTREAVGYGKLIIPNAAGNPSDSMDALLIKIYRTYLDSFYIGGSAAPQQLLNTFGLTQGSIQLDTFYVFYAADFGAPVMNINTDGNTVTSVFYRTAAATNTVSSVQEVSQLQAVCFPNPAKAGNTVVIEAEASHAGATQANIINLQGQQLSQVPLATSTAQTNRYRFALPDNLPVGIVILQLQNNNGQTLGLTKLLIEE